LIAVAKLAMPAGKWQVTLRIDAGVLDWFRAQARATRAE
jgi:uncharacterized protein (DUF4415 family)